MRRRWLGTLLLVPLLAGGCAVAADKATPDDREAAAPWLDVVDGRATPSPVPGGRAGTRTPYPSGFLPLPSQSATATPSASSTCPPESNHVMNFADVVPASTSAAVTFYNPGGNSLVEYRVTAISQDLAIGEQRDVGWTVLTPGTGCGFLTATVVGLDPKTDYVFSVDEVTTRHGRDGTESATVARSGVVRTL